MSDKPAIDIAGYVATEIKRRNMSVNKVVGLAGLRNQAETANWLRGKSDIRVSSLQKILSVLGATAFCPSPTQPTEQCK